MILYIVIIVVILAVVASYFVYAALKNNSKSKAELFLAEGRIDEAIYEFKKILASQPFDVSIKWRLAELYLKQNEIDTAIDHLEDIININQYTDDVKNEAVFKFLADLYSKKGDKLRAFELYYDLLYEYPNDPESLYHVGFLSLGQELFDVACKHLELLTQMKKDNFEILFGAGIAAFQNNKISEAILLFKDALSVNSDSDIANIAMAFALYKKANFKSAVDYARNVIDNSKDNNAIFIARRLLTFIYVEMGNYSLAVKLLEELKDDCINNEFEDELKIVLYDMGFANLANNNTDEAYSAWNQLFLMDRSFRNIIDIIARLRSEMDTKSGSKTDNQKPVITELGKWKKDVFPENFLWDICGLKSDRKMDLQTIISSERTSTNTKKDLKDNEENQEATLTIGDIYKLDHESFERVSYKLCEKLGFTIDLLMDTYRGSDGIDFMATQKKSKTKTLIWIRRWKDASIGEIPLRNFAQAINDVKVKQGYFITTSPLSDAGESVLNSLEKVKVISPEELIKQLKGII